MFFIVLIFRRIKEILNGSKIKNKSTYTFPFSKIKERYFII